MIKKSNFLLCRQLLYFNSGVHDQNNVQNKVQSSRVQTTVLPDKVSLYFYRPWVDVKLQKYVIGCILYKMRFTSFFLNLMNQNDNSIRYIKF